MNNYEVFRRRRDSDLDVSTETPIPGVVLLFLLALLAIVALGFLLTALVIAGVVLWE